MKININKKLSLSDVKMEGAEKVRMKILIGPDDGSENIILRYFTVAPGGNTPLHHHNYEHVVKIEKGRGIAVDEEGNEHEVREGNSLFIKPDDMHQFRNPFDRDFAFLCIIPNPEKG